jgi:hypothetical protein
MKAKLQIKDLELELTNLYFNTEWSVQESDSIITGMRLDKEGNELGVDEILNQPIGYVSTPDEWIENEEDNLCNAALFIEEEIKYEKEEESTGYNYAHSDFITKEQRENNTQFYNALLSKCNNFSKLRTIRESVMAGQKGKNGVYFFITGASKEFWNAYNVRKAQLNQATKVHNTLRKTA